MYTADLPSNRPGFAGMLGQVESLMDSKGVVLPPEGSTFRVGLVYEGISMPAFICANTDGAGPGIIRPWVGAPKAENPPSITADLSLSVTGMGQDGQLMALGLNNFSRGIGGKKITVGRPISEHNDFGAGARYEAYSGMTVRVLLIGGRVVSNEVMVQDAAGNEMELFMESSGLPLFKQPAYLLGSTCVLAATRTTKTAQVRAA